MSEVSENYKFTSESDFPLITPPVRCPPKLMLGSEVGDKKFGKKKEMLANAILILCVCDQWCPNQARPSLRGNWRTAPCRVGFFNPYLVRF